ncbi:porin [Azospirillum rugosum]|uniref:Porin domain-containing protein n=1 Tax=Azospirillum rugosum TaxID=416170 RepID=A0ABS4SI31_9PROT|nr:porin [Azospirillum rugosum]MBP2292230.1 hypothetical protein [Azospirillum rugosum]MDQ0525989.1 hypothetical protein [Azospirillum rugosum]
MNRYLLAGCAAVALAMGAGAANAQAKFEVKVGGDAYFEAGYVSQDLDTNSRSTEFRNRFRVNIIPTAKADNGLEYGGRIRIRAANGDRSVDADRAYIFAQGAFGQVRLGVSNSFNDETYITGPMDYLPLALYDQVINWLPGNTVSGTALNTNTIGSGGASITTRNSIIWPSLNVDANATKVVYFSPRIAGLQLGASYTPRNDSNNTDMNRSKFTSSALASVFQTGIYEDVWEVGANYSNTIAGFTVKASAGYMGGSALRGTGAFATNYNDLTGWQAGAQIGYAGFAVGGSYIDYNRSGENSLGFTEGQRNYTAGIQYTTGPLVVGANYKFGADAGSTAVAGSRHLSVYEAGVGYTVAPGLTLQAQYDYVTSKFEGAQPDDDAHVVLVRSVLAF